MLEILQARLQQYVNFQMFKLVLEKAEEPGIQPMLPALETWVLTTRLPGKALCYT